MQLVTEENTTNPTRSEISENNIINEEHRQEVDEDEVKEGAAEEGKETNEQADLTHKSEDPKDKKQIRELQEYEAMANKTKSAFMEKRSETACSSSEVEEQIPKNVRQMRRSNEREQYDRSYLKEMEDLNERGAFIIIPRSDPRLKNINILKARVVFDKKKNIATEEIRFKTRFNARGDMQRA